MLLNPDDYVLLQRYRIDPNTATMKDFIAVIRMLDEQLRVLSWSREPKSFSDSLETSILVEPTQVEPKPAEPKRPEPIRFKPSSEPPST
jgi:hypothetical protein